MNRRLRPSIVQRMTQCITPLFVGLVISHFVHAGELDYQKRGDYWEGTRAKPVSSGFGLELISAVADYRDPPGQVGDEFRARFYLQAAGKVCLVARERDNRRYYWLDQVSPRPSWGSGFRNEFAWPTGPVVKPLGLGLYDLGVVARLDCGEPGASERIAPVVLYQANPPKTVNGYVFTFKLSEGMNLTAQVFYQDSDQPVFELDLGNRFGPGVFDLPWPAKGRVPGDYRLSLRGYRMSDNAPVYQAVRFYHQPRVD